MHTIRLAAALFAVALLFAGRATAAPRDGTIGIDEVAAATSGKGVVVKKFADESPARQAGIKEDDVILKVGQKFVSSPEEFNDAVKAARPGSKIKVSVQRGSKQMLIDVKVAAVK
ncbi:MAG: PDZ domain-containing protein [Gemmataceae bacterium]